MEGNRQLDNYTAAVQARDTCSIPKSDESIYFNEALWQGLSAAETDEIFIASWLAIQSEMIGGVHCSMVVVDSTNKKLYTSVASFPPETPTTQNLLEISNLCLREGSGVLKRDDTTTSDSDEENNYLIAYPVRLQNHMYGAVAFEIIPRSKESLQCVKRQLQWGIALLERRLMPKDDVSSSLSVSGFRRAYVDNISSVSPLILGFIFTCPIWVSALLFNFNIVVIYGCLSVSCVGVLFLLIEAFKQHKTILKIGIFVSTFILVYEIYYLLRLMFVNKFRL